MWLWQVLYRSSEGRLYWEEGGGYESAEPALAGLKLWLSKRPSINLVGKPTVGYPTECGRFQGHTIYDWTAHGKFWEV